MVRPTLVLVLSLMAFNQIYTIGGTPFGTISAIGTPYLGLNSFDLPEVFQQPMLNKRYYDLPQYEEPIVMMVKKRHTANSIWRILPKGDGKN